MVHSIKKCGGGGGGCITKEVTGTTQVNILTEFFCTSSSPLPPRSSMSSSMVAGFNKFSGVLLFMETTSMEANKQAAFFGNVEQKKYLEHRKKD